MARSKKEFSKEAMYKKIMPTISKSNNGKNDEDPNISDEQVENTNSNINLNVDESIGINLSTEFLESSIEQLHGLIEDINFSKSDRSKEVVDYHNIDVLLEDEFCLGSEEKNMLSIDDTQAASDADIVENLNIITDENDAKNEDDVDYSNVEIETDFIRLLIEEKLPSVLDKFLCCRCEQCLEELITLAHVSLPDYKFKGTEAETADALVEFKRKNPIDVTTGLIKAIVSIRNKPKH